jgi:D-amino-acid oxidase
MNRHEVTRRNFLRTALAAGAVLMADGSMRSTTRAGELGPARHSNLFVLNEPHHFAPVKVARNRIIRTVVGLRPYRDEGFVVEAERLGNKLLVHNAATSRARATCFRGATESFSAVRLTTTTGRLNPMPNRRRK